MKTLLEINRVLPKVSPRAEADRARVIARVRAVLAALAWVILAAYSSVAWGQVQYAYDAAGRLAIVYAPNGDAAQYVYDAAGNITQINRFTAATLSIIQFNPDAGPIGTTVTIYGTAFNATPSANTVKFNGTVASISSGTTSQLVATVPVGATTGPISVTNGGNTTTSSHEFTVGQPTATPTISGFTPTIGTAGTAVTINGTNFDPQPIRDVARFNLTQAAVTSATATTLATSVPSGASSGKIGVTTPFGTATSTADFFIPPAPYTAASVGATGRVVVDGGTLPVNITTAGKIALILFDGVTGQNIGVGIGGVTFPSGSTAVVSVLNPNGTTLVAATTFSAGASLDLPPLPVTGTYTILIVPSSTARLNATLTVSSDLTGTFAGPGATITFSTARVGQNGRYTFNGTAGSAMGVSISNDTIASTKVEMRKPDGTVLASLTIGASGGQIPLQTLPVTGVYTVFASPVADNIGKLDLQIGAPDLNVSSASIGAITVNRNGSYSFPVSFTVNNVGGATALASNWCDVGYLSSNATLDDGDPVAGYTCGNTNLAAGGSYVVNATYTTATTTASGTYTLFLKADGRGSGIFGGTNTDNGNVGETNEANNTQALTITLPVKPDLTVSGGTVGAITVHENGSYIIPVSFTVTNVGGATALPSWYDVGYLSSDATLDDNDKVMGLTPHDTALAANGSYVVNATLGAPIVTTSGTYTLFLKADGREPFEGGRNTDNGHVAEENEVNNTQALTLTLPGKPDLIVTSVSVGAITLNQNGSYSFPVTYTVKNVGQLTANVDGYSGGWWDIGYLSVDGVLDGSDPRVSGVPGDIRSSPYHNTALAAGASYTTTATYTTPTTITQGIYTLFVKASGAGDLWEENTTNNTKALAITLPGKPDLTVTSASIGAITVHQDGSYSFPVTYTVKNVGATAAQPYWFDLAYLSEDALFDDNDPRLAGIYGRTTALGAGASYTVTTTFATLPTTTPRTYTLFVKADSLGGGYGGTNTDGGVLAEASETNNVRAVTLTLPVKPDLTVTSASVGAITISGSNYSLPVTFTVKNVGGSTAQPSWSDWAYLSVDGVLDSNDPGLSAVSSANAHTTTLAPGTTYTKTVTYTAPTTTAPGPYTLFVKTDGDYFPTDAGVLTETNETNNVQALAITLPAPKPDLTVSTLTVGSPITVAQNGAYNFPVTYKVTNSGPVTAAPSWYDVGYLSSDGVLDDGDLVLTGYRQRTTALTAAGSYTIIATFTTAATTAPGTYTLFMKADGKGGGLGGANTDSGSVAETDESNNTRAATITLPAKPDLTVSIVSVGTIVKNTNGSYKIPVTYKVTNVGGAAAQASWYDTAYLSGNATLDDTDAALAGYHTQVAGLAVNGSYTINGTFTTSTTTPAGTYTLFVKADGRSTALSGTNTDAGKVTEAGETNNTASISVVLP